LGLRVGLGLRDRVRGPGLNGGNQPGFSGGNQMRNADRSAMCPNTVPVRPVRMTGMRLGCNRCELNGDQKDRRPKNPQKRSGRIHERFLPYGPGQGNQE
jgi:hypothetical protein